MANTMNVWGGYTSKPYNGMQEGRRIKLNEKDIDISLGPDFADNVLTAAAVLWQSSLNVTHGKEFIKKTVFGVTPAMPNSTKSECFTEGSSMTLT